MSSLYPPGPAGNFLVGNMRQFKRDRLSFLLNTARNYGDIAHLRMVNQHFYMVNHPDYVHEVLVKYPEKFEKGPAFKNSTRNSIGQGLLTSEGDFHKRQRRLVQPAFHHKRIEAYADVMVDYAGRQMDTWRSGQEIDIHRELMALTMQIVAKTLFDADLSRSTDKLGEAIGVGIEATGQRIAGPSLIPQWFPTPGNRRQKQASALLDKTMMEIINQRRATNTDTGDLLSMLLLAVDEDDGGQMTNRQVRDEAMTLFIAGHETTANALTWTLYLLAQHPDIEAKLVEEINTALNGRPATMKDMARLPYCDRVIKESMRLYPPVWGLSRLVIEPVVIGGYAIEPGSMIVLSPYAMHRDPRFYDAPECFRPERFAPGYDERLPKYAYFPFGGGPRVCIGNQFAMMEANLVLATLLQRYHMTLVSGQTVTPEPLVTLRPKTGINLRVTERERVPVQAAMMPILS